MIWLSIAMMVLGFVGHVVFFILLRGAHSRNYSVLGFISMLSVTFGCMLFLRLMGVT